MSNGECCCCIYVSLLFFSAFGIYAVTTSHDITYVFFHNGTKAKVHLQFSVQECDVFQAESVAPDSRFVLSNITWADRRLNGRSSGEHSSGGHSESTGHVHTTVNVMHSGSTGYASHYSIAVSRTNRWIVVSAGFHMMMIMSDGSVKYVPSVGEMRFIKIMTIEPNDNYVELSGDSTSLYVCYADLHKNREFYIIFAIVALTLIPVACFAEAWCESGGRYPSGRYPQV